MSEYDRRTLFVFVWQGLVCDELQCFLLGLIRINNGVKNLYFCGSVLSVIPFFV